eukprot:335410_1
MSFLALHILFIFLWFTGSIKAVPVGDFLSYNDLNGKPYTVGYDQRSFIINGSRTLLLGGAVHYPRVSYYEWKDILLQMKEDGLNHVQTYVFWNLHEPTYNFNGTHIYNYNGRANITHYLEIAKEVGMFLNMRIGPYVASEWKFGGVPAYLLHVNGLIFRGYEQQWMQYMQQWMQEISDKIRPYLAKYGGPVILAQIENEYKISAANAANGTKYVEWCGELAMSLNYDIPWGMCHGATSNLTINTCNCVDCYEKCLSAHIETYPNQPLSWTEDEGYHQAWQGQPYNPNKTSKNNRTPQDMANVVTKWFGGGGSHHNYYMYLGGNHLENYAGSGIANWYSDGVNYHSDSLPNEPKRSHLNRLHQILADKQYILLSDQIQYGKEIPLKTNQSNLALFAYVYAAPNGDTLTFLYNNGSYDFTVLWQDIKYYLPSHSVSIVDNENIELYNSAKVNSDGLPTQRVYIPVLSDFRFSSWTEPFFTKSNQRNDGIVHQTPLEQIRLTNDTNNHLIYSTNFSLNYSTTIYNDVPVMLRFDGCEGNTYWIYFDSSYVGEVWNGYHTPITTVNYSLKIQAKYINRSLSIHSLLIVSTSLGIESQAKPELDERYMDQKGIAGSIGAVGTVELYDSETNKLIVDLTKNQWIHYIGLYGEILGIQNDINGNKVKWTTPPITTNPATWYKTEFMMNSTQLQDVILLDIGENPKGLNRGHFYLNGYDMGYYNDVIQQNTTVMVQRYYFIPKDFINTNSQNLLIFADELPNATLSNIQIVRSTVIIPEY